MSTEFTFVVEKQCPVCGEHTRVVKVKSRLMATQVDSDYCCHYRDFDPYLYHVWVCEHCGYAADEKVFLMALPNGHKKKVTAALREKHINFEFHEYRDMPDGVASLKLAIYCAEVLKAPLARRAGLTLRLAWLYRLNDEKDLERKYIERAVELYERSLMRERYPIDNLTDDMVTYLLGALYADLGDDKKAIIYLSKLTGNNSQPVANDKLARDARKLWQEIRARGHFDDNVSEPESESGKGVKGGRKAAGKSSGKKKKGLSKWF